MPDPYINPDYHPMRVVEIEDESEPEMKTVPDTERPVPPEPMVQTLQEFRSEQPGSTCYCDECLEEIVARKIPEPSPHLDMLRVILRDAMSYQLCRPWCEQDDIELERKCQDAIDSMAVLRESLKIDAFEPSDSSDGCWTGEGE